MTEDCILVDCQANERTKRMLGIFSRALITHNRRDYSFHLLSSEIFLVLVSESDK